MSKDWEVVQEKAFTAWVNGVLDPEEKVSDITTDFNDGIKLIHFLERLSAKKIGKKIEDNPKTRIHKIQNLHLALQFTTELEVSFQGVGAEDFVDNNKKLILGYLWALYRKYRIAVIKEGDKNSEEALLLWCKNTTSSYAGVDIKSFKTGFRDGNAFLALAHKYDPTLFEYDDFQSDTPENRLEKAFDIAEKAINIPKLLDAGEVMKGTSDERSLILYTSLFFHAFGAKAQKEALDAAQRDAANKLGNLESDLHSAQMSKDQLLKQKTELEQAKADLTKSLEERNRELEERNRELEKRNEENRKLKEELDAANNRIKELESKLSGLEEKYNALESKFNASESSLKDEKSTNEDLSSKLTRLQSEKDHLSSKLDDASKNLDNKGKQSDVELSALLLLRQQFDQHVLDMHRWRKLAEVDVADFITETKTPLVEELAKEGSFDKHLDILKHKLDEETKDIQKYLLEKEEFVKQRTKSTKK